MVPSKAWMRSGVILAMIEFLESHGLEPLEVLGRKAVLMVEAANAYRQVDLHYMLSLFQETSERTGRMDFCLQLGLQADLTQLGPWGFQFLNAPTIGDALGDFAKFGPIFQTQTHFASSVERKNTRIEYSSNRFGVRGWELDNEVSIAYVMGIVNSLAGRVIPPVRIHFEHAPVCTEEQYIQHLGLHPMFEQEVNQVVYPNSVMALPVRDANPELYLVITRHLKDIAASLPLQDSLRDLVINNIRQGLDSGEPSVTLDHVASELGMNSRTLQRLLRQDGTHFQALLDKVRLDIACFYLKRTSLNVSLLSAELCYSDTSAFSRAFKRWTGVAPGTYRKENQLMT